MRIHMIAADQIKKTILKMGIENGVGAPFLIADVARELDPVNWEEVMESVNLVVEVMVLQGTINHEGEHIMLLENKQKQF